ncbi:hypothetical protein AQUCO_04200114v1 [Aquilegia coerulea]|uniref:Myb/SANT-like domain-containing protein n=1 Tax=Aquilegia coerulea TaxID=218851 RepID=A0A2G5CQL6_AQUCA|nr:hypothetical protein AQUCO_04200114v1 [Aquilegia coerulea]PIA33128.1 hypothetical protein AQUCO_04200114v1 [Aquilegia coerulea]PIA33129.1 hypothetical protein AQUCO_04200114v1 [Aquilegia coerulea]
MEESQAQSSKKRKKNFMWTAKADKFLISFLADCAKNGEKHGKSFPKAVYAKAAEAVTDYCKTLCTMDNVDSRMKTVKKKYSRIACLRSKSGWGWDDDQKIIKVGKEVAMEFIEANSYAKDLINVPLEQYEELKLVCVEDQATGSFGKSISDVQSENVDDVTSGKESSKRSKRGKRSRPWEDVLSKVDGLTEQVGRLTEALVDDSFVEKLYSEVTSMEGFEEKFLENAFDYLMAHPIEAKKFMVRRLAMRREWLQAFADGAYV